MEGAKVNDEGGKRFVGVKFDFLAPDSSSPRINSYSNICRGCEGGGGGG